MNDFTITSKEAILLTWKAQECLSHDMFFAHSLLYTSREDIEILRAIIKRANTLRATKMDEAQEKIHRGIKLTDRMLHDKANAVPTAVAEHRRRLFRLTRIKAERIQRIEADSEIPTANDSSAVTDHQV